ncbi:helix-turn-helix domain-containing protein [Butyricicoccus pullicaecorum]|uniref:HTH cro/C1-type domain-containing protein n=1 Tax=Butyricicoccus pullicaecorum 1.2 TaxID=1203606 RepID=R8W0M1_9FIRM|nr:helix-turn-helix transcriptional regulator [Butyricicoccus pullicaecorum]EOQ38485.1 hypothetical protein HMPREF1526_01518 [Butyricicoccus pullicaecorum 1.2]SKA53629.1 Helix-turn-helix domain-containing protein [Butyricicoccus pullicaecorum DSM 23266]
MASDFARTLALLRREKKISQRTAASDLGVSQALLSHYENGLREPGLSFVVRAADYYGVSCDYLLGRSMARDGSSVPAARMHDAASDESGDPENAIQQSRRLVVNSVAMLFEVAEKTGSEQLSNEMYNYLSMAIYKVFRYLYAADPGGVEEAFRTASEHFDGLCNAHMSLSELRIRAAAKGEGGFGLTREEIRLPSLQPSDLARAFPNLSSSMLTLLQAVADRITPQDAAKTSAEKRSK